MPTDTSKCPLVLTAKDVFLALIAELDHLSGYITKDPMSLSSVNVDGTISCDSIAEYLNAALEAYWQEKVVGLIEYAEWMAMQRCERVETALPSPRPIGCDCCTCRARAALARLRG